MCGNKGQTESRDLDFAIVYQSLERGDKTGNFFYTVCVIQSEITRYDKPQEQISGSQEKKKDIRNKSPEAQILERDYAITVKQCAEENRLCGEFHQGTRIYF